MDITQWIGTIASSRYGTSLAQQGAIRKWLELQAYVRTEDGDIRMDAIAPCFPDSIESGIAKLKAEADRADLRNGRGSAVKRALIAQIRLSAFAPDLPSRHVTSVACTIYGSRAEHVSALWASIKRRKYPGLIDICPRRGAGGADRVRKPKATTDTRTARYPVRPRLNTCVDFITYIAQLRHDVRIESARRADWGFVKAINDGGILGAKRWLSGDALSEACERDKHATLLAKARIALVVLWARTIAKGTPMPNPRDIAEALGINLSNADAIRKLLEPYLGYNVAK